MQLNRFIEKQNVSKKKVVGNNKYTHFIFRNKSYNFRLNIRNFLLVYSTNNNGLTNTHTDYQSLFMTKITKHIFLPPVFTGLLEFKYTFN
jgi:hypothetical protein